MRSTDCRHNDSGTAPGVVPECTSRKAGRQPRRSPLLQGRVEEETLQGIFDELDVLTRHLAENVVEDVFITSILPVRFD